MVPKTRSNMRLLRGAQDTFSGEKRHPPFCGCSECEHALLPKDAPVRIDTPNVRAYFDRKEWRVTTVAVFGEGKTSFAHDSHMYNGDKRSAPKAYAWARENASRIATMTRQQIYNGLRAAGAKIDTHG